VYSERIDKANKAINEKTSGGSIDRGKEKKIGTRKNRGGIVLVNAA